MQIKIGNLLKTFRKNNNQAQKEVYENFLSRSSYSRIESEARELFVQDLSGLLDNLSITGDEFLIYAKINQKQDVFLKLLNDFGNDPSNAEYKKSLLSYYRKLCKKKKLTLCETSNYISIKSAYSKQLKIPPLSKDEINDIYLHLKNRAIYTQYDYSIFRNMTLYFSSRQINTILYRMFPLTLENNSNANVLNFVSHIFQNLITFKIYERDFENAQKYLDLARIQEIEKTNYYYWLNINYLEELVSFVEEGSFDSFDKIRHYINIIEDLGHAEQAAILKKEVTRLMNGETINPIDEIPDVIINLKMK